MKLTIPIFYDDYADLEFRKLNDMRSRMFLVTHHSPHETTYTLVLSNKKYLRIFVETVGGCAVSRKP